MLREGTVLRGIYRIDSYLSSGGFGNTYVATHVEFDEQLAIKEFFMKGVTEREESTCYVSVSNSENIPQFEEQREKFKKEARRLHKLKNEHIVKVHDLFEENGTAYYVMDYIDGESLTERLRRTGVAFNEDEVRSILRQVLEALEEVHHNKIWHLDMKPSNIMLGKDGIAYLIDFGASKQIRANGSLTTSTALCYTPGYAPNEQIGQMYDLFGPWTDIYALGATVYNLLSNKKPPTSIDIEESEEAAFSFPNDISEDMKSLVIWMMQPKRKDRPQSVMEVRSKLVSPEKVLHSEETLVDTKHRVSIQNPLFSPVIQNLISNMVRVEGGTFKMGATSEQDSDAYDDEEPVHQVTLSSFSIGKYEVTQEEWMALMGNNPSNFKEALHPVEQVSWDDCQKFILKLNELTGMNFRLPSEAEWEFAARGGNKSLGYKYAGSDDIGYVAWYYENSGGSTHEVGRKAANELGLYDMSGNVWEWCADWYGHYTSTDQTNPKGAPNKDSRRVRRGGSWYHHTRGCRLSRRDDATPLCQSNDLGFRLAL